MLLARAARSARSESQACSLGSLGARCPSLVPERQLGSLERRFGACSFAQLERAELLLLRADFRSRALERKFRSDAPGPREAHHWSLTLMRPVLTLKGEETPKFHLYTVIKNTV